MKLLDRFAAFPAANPCHDRSLPRLPQPPVSSPSSPQHTSRPLAPPLLSSLSAHPGGSLRTSVVFAGACLLPEPCLALLESLSLLTACLRQHRPPSPAASAAPSSNPCLRSPLRQGGVRHNILALSRFVKLIPYFFSFFLFSPPFFPSPKSSPSLLPRASQLFVIH